jgi:2,3-bisphosphoglycerate-independent phosphoglycerate mutase
MSGPKSERQTGLSEKAKQNLELNAQLRKQDSNFFNPQPGEKSVLIFDAEKIQPVKKIFDDKPFQKFHYTVQDPNTDNEKYWTVSKRTSEQIDAYLTEGQNVLKVHRIGAGTDTRYTIMPAY